MLYLGILQQKDIVLKTLAIALSIQKLNTLGNYRNETVTMQILFSNVEQFCSTPIN